MLAVGMGGGVMVIWLVLAPKLPGGAADEELRAPFPMQIEQRLDLHGAGPPAIGTEQPPVPPPPAEQQPLVRPETDTINAVVAVRSSGMPPMMSPVDIRAGHRLRCAHNAASVR
jgi:hypothetical protein